MKSEQESKKKRRRMIRKGKKKVEEDTNTDLLLKIKQAFGINNKSCSNPYYGSNFYTVVAYTEPEDRYEVTPLVKVFQGEKLIFNTILEIPLESPARYVYIELVRRRRKSLSSDPGTSTGIVVMGRAKIKLPPPNSRDMFDRTVSLVGLDSDRCVEEKGTLDLKMKLRS